MHTYLVAPTLPPGESLQGQRSQRASVFEETLHDSDDSTISDIGTERSADEDNEILQTKSLSTVENSSNALVDVISDPSIS